MTRHTLWTKNEEATFIKVIKKHSFIPKLLCEAMPTKSLNSINHKAKLWRAEIAADPNHKYAHLAEMFYFNDGSRWTQEEDLKMMKWLQVNKKVYWWIEEFGKVMKTKTRAQIMTHAYSLKYRENLNPV